MQRLSIQYLFSFEVNFSYKLKASLFDLVLLSNVRLVFLYEMRTGNAASATMQYSSSSSSLLCGVTATTRVSFSGRQYLRALQEMFLLNSSNIGLAPKSHNSGTHTDSLDHDRTQKKTNLRRTTHVLFVEC